MSIVNFIAEKWSALVELAAQEMSIARRVTGSQYQADASGTKAIHSAMVGDIDIIDYVNDTDLSALQSLTDIGNDILLDQKKAFNFSVDDVDKAQSQANFESAAMTQAGKKLALEGDKYVFGFYDDAGIPAGNKVGAVAASISITELNVDQYVYELKDILDAQNAPEERWLAVPGWFISKLALAGLDKQLADTTKEGIWRTGEVILYAGFNIVRSNSLSAVGAGSDEYQIMAYSSRAIPFVAQIQKVEALRNTARFGDIVRGLYVFGGSVKHPKEVAVLSATKG